VWLIMHFGEELQHGRRYLSLGTQV